MAFNGANFIVAYTDESYTPTAILAARVTPSGTVIDPNGIPIITGGSVAYGCPQLCPYDTFAMLVYHQSNLSTGTVYGQRLTRNLVKIGGSFAISISTPQKSDVRISFDGANFLVVWREKESPFTVRLMARMINKNGSVISDEITVASGLNYQAASIDLCFKDTNYLLVYTTDTELKGQSISKSGALAGPGFTITTSANGISSPAVGYANGNFLVSFSKKPGTDYNVYGNNTLVAIDEFRPVTVPTQGMTSLIARSVIVQKGEQLHDITGRVVNSATGAGIYFLKDRKGSVTKVIITK